MRRKLWGRFLFVACLLLSLTARHASARQAIRYSTLEKEGAFYHVVIANLESGRVSSRTFCANRCTSVWNMIEETRPTVALTGTFFNLASGSPVGDVLVDGKLAAKGERASAVAVDWFGKVSLLDTSYREKMDWFGYRFALRGAVRLIRKGRVCPDPKSQRFRDSAIWGSAARTGVGLTQKGDLILCATQNAITLSELGRAMLTLGAREAVSLDGGSSTCLYYRGSMVVPPKRKLTNLFVLQETSPFDELYAIKMGLPSSSNRLRPESSLALSMPPFTSSTQIAKHHKPAHKVIASIKTPIGITNAQAPRTILASWTPNRSIISRSKSTRSFSRKWSPRSRNVVKKWVKKKKVT